MSKHGVRDNVMDDAARIGFVQRRLPPDFRRVEWTLACSKCTAVLRAHFAQNMKPEAMASWARVRKWDCGYGMRPLCPTCLHGNKAPAPKPDGQSFDRFIPPPTAVYDALLVAADRRVKLNKVDAAKEKLREYGFEGDTPAEAWEWCDKVDAEDAKKLKAEKREAHAAQVAADKLAAQQDRCRRAQAMRAQRLRELKAQREQEALHKPVPATAIDGATSPEESAPQAVIAPQAEEEVMNTQSTIAPTPSPKITHAVFQMLDDIFDAQKRLYKSGYTDQRVAKDCGTTEAVVAYLRNETFGALAEDPRFTALRDDLELLRMESAEVFARLQKQLNEASSRLEQLAHHK